MIMVVSPSRKYLEQLAPSERDGSTPRPSERPTDEAEVTDAAGTEAEPELEIADAVVDDDEG